MDESRGEPEDEEVEAEVEEEETGGGDCEEEQAPRGRKGIKGTAAAVALEEEDLDLWLLFVSSGFL